MSRRTDITDLKLAEAELRAAQGRLEQIAFTDPLTGLANRRRFQDWLADALAPPALGDAEVGLLFLDLDRFKDVNDTLGHAAGDRVLADIAARLNESIGADHGLARIGGDEFAVLWRRERAGATIAALAERIVAVLAAPCRIDERRLPIGASIGIAVAARDGRGADTLLRRADLALYRAKASGGGTFRFYDGSMDAEQEERRAIGVALREAIGVGQFDVHYQPVVDARSGAVVGVESLMRWRHPTRGVIGPDIFVPLAEEIGAVGQLGAWVMRRVCADSRHLPPGLRLAVNVSPRQLAAADMAALVRDAAAAHGLALERIELEITETAVLRDDPSVLASMRTLRALGVRIALDDFGTGYASLRYLCKFPFSSIKIDRSFIDGMIDRPDCRAVVIAVVALGGKLGLRTTAEGVETPAQLAAVGDAGCDEVQGYMVARPMPLPELIRWLSRTGAGRRWDGPVTRDPAAAGVAVALAGIEDR